MLAGGIQPARGFSPALWIKSEALSLTPVLALAVTLFAPMAFADDARQIVEEAQRRAHASSERYEGTLTVFNRTGKIAEKRWRYERIGSHGNSKSIIRFSSPAEVKGVALLIVNHPERSSDQWMWTPALERNRRIAMQDRRRRFFGTDFSFEDLEERDAGQYDFRMLGEETLEGQPCWKIESRPKETKTSQYGRSVIWIRKDHYVWWRLENYSQEKLVRRARYGDLENVSGIWTARTVEMTDVREGSRTVLRLEKLDYNAPMKDEQFTLQALRREL